MTVSPVSPAPLVGEPARPVKIECAQVHGGTGAESIPIGLSGLEGFLFSRPCRSANGGDIHYLSICGSGLLSRFWLADVVGHGEEVALVSAETHDLLRRSVNWTDHRRTLEILNRTLCERGLDSLTTAAVFTYFPGTRNLTYSYAGHPRAWHWSAARKRWSELAPERGALDRFVADTVHDLPLAVASDTTYTRMQMRPAVDDVIVITTDGVTDALNPAGRRLGSRGLGAMLASLDEASPRAIVESIVERLEDRCGVQDFEHDDVTILALRINAYSKLEAVREMIANRIVRPWKTRGRAAPSRH